MADQPSRADVEAAGMSTIHLEVLVGSTIKEVNSTRTGSYCQQTVNKVQ